MICKQCGGTIPEGGKFCPECGTPVTLKAAALKKPPARAAHTARPLADNPFQPRPAHRKSPAPATSAPEKEQEAVDIEDIEGAEEVAVETSHPIPEAPRPRPRKPVREAPATSGAEPDEDAGLENGAEERTRPVTATPRKKRPRPATPSAEGEEASPRRARPEPEQAADKTRAKAPPESEPPEKMGVGRTAIAPAPPPSRKVNTMVPKRLSPEELEMDEFFGSSDEDLESDGQPSFWERNLRSVITIGLLAATVLVLVCLLTFSSFGKVFLAGLNITKDAHAYKLLGDQLTQNGQTKSASEAYHQAVIYDPDNYDYAMLCAQAYSDLHDTEKAAQAAQLAISLEPNARAPYDLLKELFPASARPANIADILADGATRFGDPSLAQ